MRNELRNYPITDLNVCSVRGCIGQSTSIIQKRIGEEYMLYGYCEFHSIISETFFTNPNDRIVIPYVKFGR